MAAFDPRDEHPQVALTPELQVLLGKVADGHTVDIVDRGVVVGRLVRVAAESADVREAVALAARIMDRYQNAYRELAK
jgi:antitoxin (DNA-binding transcriptional repressor) of toxin-antitoxin stability system